MLCTSRAAHVTGREGFKYESSTRSKDSPFQ